jgi:hypothetical protein
MAEKRDRGKRAYLAVLMLLFFLASSTVLRPRNVAASTESGRVLGDSIVPAERAQGAAIRGAYEN